MCAICLGTADMAFRLRCLSISIHLPLCRDPFDGKWALIYNAPEVLIRRTGPKKHTLSEVKMEMMTVWHRAHQSVHATVSVRTVG